MILISSKFKYISFRNKNNKLHRDTGPALINVNYQVWYQNGERHRLDGPAYINGNYEAWYKNGIRCDAEKPLCTYVDLPDKGDL